MAQKTFKEVVSVIIPAFNEEQSIGAVVSVAATHPSVHEVIVVDDGSTDDTRMRAEEEGAFVISLDKNYGKGYALNEGVRRARGQVLLFLDADIYGVTHTIISFLLNKVREGGYDMFVAIRGRKLFWMNKLLRIAPVLGGERALRRAVWNSVPKGYKNRFEIEIALNYYTKRTGRRMGFAVVHGLHHLVKEAKHGFWRGLWERVRMVGNILLVSFRLYVIERMKR